MDEKVPNNKGFFNYIFCTAFYFLRMYLVGTWWLGHQLLNPHRMLKEIPKRSGDTAIVTGGSRGIGAEIVKQLLQADMTVVIACRDVAAGKKVIKECRSSGITSGKGEVIHLDLSSLKSVEKFAKNFLAGRTRPLHVLINNAAYIGPHKMTVDGLESQFQVNYLGHFLLTLLLLPALISGGKAKEGQPSRVVNVTSVVSLLGKVQFDDLPMRKYYNRNLAYCNTKLFQVVSSNYFNSRFLKAKVPIESFAVHPGIVCTDLFVNFQLFRLLKFVLIFVGWSPKQGSDPVVYTALSEELHGHGGKMLSNCNFMEPNPQAKDATIQAQLWEESCNLVKLENNKLFGDSVGSGPIVLLDIE